MSGILGIFNLDGRPVDSEWLDGMKTILSHRGPDGGHIWIDGHIGLGHQMLWTTPESLIEILPYTISEADLTIVADARIDNREELIAALSLRHAPAAEKTDSRLILAAYQKWGEDCVDRLTGDFSFAIWEGRSQSIFCARDHLRIRPFRTISRLYFNLRCL